MVTRIEAKRLIPGRGPWSKTRWSSSTIVRSRSPAGRRRPETAGADVVISRHSHAGDVGLPRPLHRHLHRQHPRGVHHPPPAGGDAGHQADAQAVLQPGSPRSGRWVVSGPFLGRAIEEGAVEGPNVYGSGSMLSMTAGHGDSHSLDLTVARLLHTHTWGEDNIVDGPDECRAGVRRMLRLGAKVIKVHASGGVLSELDDPHLPQFSKPELEAIVDEATRMERLVGAHCHGKRGIMAALEAGIKTIEHGTFLDEEAADSDGRDRGDPGADAVHRRPPGT